MRVKVRDVMKLASGKEQRKEGLKVLDTLWIMGWEEYSLNAHIFPMAVQVILEGFNRSNIQFFRCVCVCVSVCTKSYLLVSLKSLYSHNLEGVHAMLNFTVCRILPEVANFRNACMRAAFHTKRIRFQTQCKDATKVVAYLWPRVSFCSSQCEQ